MATFTPVILVCSAALQWSPSLGWTPIPCAPETAVDVVRGQPAPNEIMCGLYAEMQMARTDLVRGGTWLKIGCERRRS